MQTRKVKFETALVTSEIRDKLHQVKETTGICLSKQIELALIEWWENKGYDVE